MIEIQPIGTIYTVDTNGFLISQSSRECIQSEFLPVLDRVVEIYQEVLGNDLHSIYVRGTVSRGVAQLGISDVDTFALLKEGSGLELDSAIWEEYRSDLRFIVPQVTDIELDVWKWEKQTKPTRRLTLKVQSTCIWGNSVIPDLEPVAIDQELVSGLGMNIGDLISTAQMKIIDIPNKREALVKWIMKAMIRTGSVLVMERSQSFTRDLYPSWQLFSQYYPDQSAQMQQAIEWYLNPDSVSDKVVLEYLDSFGGWLTDERKRIG